MDQQETNAFNWNEFSQRTWVVVVSGLVFPPLGIFLSWRKPDWTPKAKWIATGLMGLLLIGRMGGSEKREPSDPGNRTEAAAGTDQKIKQDQSLGGTASKSFKSVVERLRNAGFRMESVQPSGSEYLSSAVGVKSDGEDDVMVCVTEFRPFTREELMVVGEQGAAPLVRGKVGMLVSTMGGAIRKISQDLRLLLSYKDGIEKSSNLKHTGNGSTTFAGIMIIGQEQSEVSWAQETRQFPSTKIWRLEYGGNVLVTGLDEPGESRESRTKAIMNLLTGGASR